MKIPHSTLLASLIAIASVAGAVMYSKKSQQTKTKNPAQLQKITELQNQIEILKGENKTLKKLQINGAEIKLPISHYKFVENNLGLTFPNHVPARRVDNEYLVKSVTYQYTQQFGIEGMAKRQYAFEKLGLTPPNQYLTSQLAIAEAVGAVAIYDPSAKEILLSPEFDDENLLHTTSIIKHLSIALLKLNFPLQQKEKNNLTDDAYHAREAFIKGRATSIAQRFRNITSLKGGHMKQFKPNTVAQETFQSLPTLIQGLATFPTIFGKSYIEEIMLKNDSVFPELYQNMPKSTATILARTMPKKASIPAKKAPTANQHLDTQLGQIFAMLYLKQLGNAHTELAKKLSSDRLTITQNQQIHTTSWQTTWSSEQYAQLFHKLATELSTIPIPNPTVKISGKQVTITTSDTQNS